MNPTPNYFGPQPFWAPGGPDWLWWGASAVLGLLALWLLWRSLLRDRSRGRARCPKCWYDLRGSLDPNSLPSADPDAEPDRRRGSNVRRIDRSEFQELTCPECGRVVKREKHMFRTRRRWNHAIVALLLFLIASIGGALPRARAYGPVSLLPTTALLTLDRYEHFEQPTGVPAPVQTQPGKHGGIVAEELWRREPAPFLSAWQWRLWLRHSGFLDPMPRAYSDLTTYSNGKVSVEQLETPAGYGDYYFNRWSLNTLVVITFEPGTMRGVYDETPPDWSNNAERRFELRMIQWAMDEPANASIVSAVDRFGLPTPDRVDVTWIGGLAFFGYNGFADKTFAQAMPNSVYCRGEVLTLRDGVYHYLDLGWFDVPIHLGE